MIQPLPSYIDEAVERIIDKVCLMSDLTDTQINGDESLRSYLRGELFRVGKQATRPR